MSDAQRLISRSLQRERTKKGYSINELSKLAKVAKSTLSQIEAGSGNPSIETVWALSTALNVPFSALMAPHEPEVQVIRNGEGLAIQSDQADYKAVLLSSCPPSARRDLYLTTVQPGEVRHSKPHSDGVREHVVIAQGRAMVGLVDDPVELLQGDYICYPGDQAHVFEALEPDTMAIFLTEH
ncbi:helix-turn-helix domain-containing protein [Marinomonas mediterranea]|jgi:Predicted transcriptional regulators|nr:helix-turn-helix domain-containing protein [Marinomonas mediterranea]WCN15404.1 helix-turn-helix domain-containing protein [Marinomonas mediterranea]WCN19463.1 helix-turn-helix domain-containing protein [Marinomonas mediterranea MMB-1]